MAEEFKREQRKVGSSFSFQPMADGVIARYMMNDKSSIKGGLIGCITDYFRSIGGQDEKVTINPGKTLPVHTIRERFPEIGFVEVSNYDNSLEVKLLGDKDEIISNENSFKKAKQLLIGFENILKEYPRNAEEFGRKVEEKSKKISEDIAKYHEEHPDFR